MSELRSCVVEAMICGYHEYQSIWEAEVGENLTCIQQPGNVRDPSLAPRPLPTREGPGDEATVTPAL